ncbi:MAG: hypothetical protein DRG83_19700 [Deltaproteobacteria bacterium]|nr:MAG: hypothetical protein DRG83_19700 [Deltaproteobacteria bacterium]
MGDPLLIYGASGHAKVIIDIIEREGRYEIKGLIDDNPKKSGENFFGYPIIGGGEILGDATYHDHWILLAIGGNLTRKKIWDRLRSLGYKFASAIHPSAQIGRDVRIGEGTVVMANVVINPSTRVGRNAIINTGATVDHDCDIGDFVHISPGAHLAGGVSVGELTHDGIGASVIHGVKIGKKAIIGAGAVVISDVPDGVTVVGVPAEAIER